jgi:hypothetical protein
MRHRLYETLEFIGTIVCPLGCAGWVLWWYLTTR